MSLEGSWGRLPGRPLERHGIKTGHIEAVAGPSLGTGGASCSTTSVHKEVELCLKLFQGSCRQLWAVFGW
eukprot:15448076-Alexandrium_andersonii.AAC.1